MSIQKAALCLFLAITVNVYSGTTAVNTTKLPDEVRAKQVRDMKWGMFICWSFSTFSGSEWTPTKGKDASFFKATGCDTDQWCRTARDAGMGYILFLSKHHDGFCLWDTKTTEKKVTNSPLGVDVLAKLRKSCDRYGIKLALYFSEGDWNWPGAVDGKRRGGTNPEVKKAQLKELLTGYGPIEFWWMDHAIGTGGLSHAETVEWMHRFQPDTFVGFNHGKPSGRLCLREMGRAGRIGDKGASKYNKAGEGSFKGYYVAEFTYPILPRHRGGAMWFYSLPRHDNLCHPAGKLYKDYQAALKYGNLFSINIGPNYAGKIRDIDVKTLKEVGELINKDGKDGAQGTLRVSRINPRYFTDKSGKAVYLTGSHTWNNLVDMSAAEPPERFDFPAYVQWMKRYNHNFMRLWAWELVNWNTQGNREKKAQVHSVFPQPWMRTGPGKALDGKPKFNLKKHDPVYFKRLKERVKLAAEHDIYVSVMLFEGWGLQFSPSAFLNHPFHPANNINGINGDGNSDGSGVEIHALADEAITALQEAYIKEVVQTVNSFDNILYEISNENHPPSTKWQYHMIRFIKDLEKKLPKQHPVGMTFQYKGGSNSTLFQSPADWISPNPHGGYRDNPPPSDGAKVIITDTDHLWGIGGNHQWVWKSFLRGLNPIFMDPYKCSVLRRSFDPAWAEPLRRSMGYTLKFADRMDLIHMVPEPKLASTGYCLANRGKEYLVYLPRGREVAVDLKGCSGSYKTEWFDPVSGKSKKAEPVEGGGKVSLRSPFGTSGAVLYFKLQKDSE